MNEEKSDLCNQINYMLKDYNPSVFLKYKTPYIGLMPLQCFVLYRQITNNPGKCLVMYYEDLSQQDVQNMIELFEQMQPTWGIELAELMNNNTATKYIMRDLQDKDQLVSFDTNLVKVPMGTTSYLYLNEVIKLIRGDNNVNLAQYAADSARSGVFIDTHDETQFKNLISSLPV